MDKATGHPRVYTKSEPGGIDCFGVSWNEVVDANLTIAQLSTKVCHTI